MSSNYDLITILGPTACGKTRLAVALCYYIDGEVISADSRQVYRGMDLGTGKDLSDYVYKNKKIPYHLIDIIDAGKKYHVFQYKQDFYKAYNDILNRNKKVVLCGGSGMYIEAILRNYELIEVPENIELRKKLESYTLEELTTILKTYKKLHNKTDVDTKKRAIRAIEIAEYYKTHNIQSQSNNQLRSLTIGLTLEREKRREKISLRLKHRLQNGMIDEVKQLLDSGISPEDLIYYGLEYKYITEYLQGKYTYEEFYKKLEIAIHQFAKRQMTYFRGMERRGIKIYWLNAEDSIEVNLQKILSLYC